MKKIDVLREYMWRFQAHYGSYHNHKETMAHAAIAAQVAFTIAVLTLDKWPPKCWNIEEVSLRIGVWVLCFVLYLYTGWEMRLRRWSAVMGISLERCVSKLAQIDFLSDYNTVNNNTKIKRRGKCYRYISCSLWFPWIDKWFGVKYQERGYPPQLVSEIEKTMERGDIRLLMLEVIFFIVSIGCLAVLILKGIL